MRKRSLLLFCWLLGMTVNYSAQSLETTKAYRIPEKNCQVLKAKLTNFITEIAKTPGAGGHIIVYEGNDEIETIDRRGRKTIKQIPPRVGEIEHQIKGLADLLQTLNAPPGKIKIVNGGYRRKFAVEFWNVPRGASPPPATPTLKKMRYRAGTVSTEFPYWDC